MVSTSAASLSSPHRLRVALGLAVLVIPACSPSRPPLQAGTNITCGGVQANPTLTITLDSTSATEPGVITVEALNDSVVGSATVVEYGRALRCVSTRGSFRITIREATAVAGQLRVAAAQPLPITIRSANGTVRAETSFDPNAQQSTTLRWGAAE